MFCRYLKRTRVQVLLYLVGRGPNNNFYREYRAFSYYFKLILFNSKRKFGKSMIYFKRLSGNKNVYISLRAEADFYKRQTFSSDAFFSLQSGQLELFGALGPKTYPRPLHFS